MDSVVKCNARQLQFRRTSLKDGGKSRKEYAQFLRIAFGSTAELETQLLLARDIYPILQGDNVLCDVEDIQKMLNMLIKKIDI